MEWYIGVLKKYAVFDGRARRKEFWMFVLINLVVAIVIGIVDGILGTSGILGIVYALGTLLPVIGVSIRRLHDTNRSGWWLLIGLIPLIGIIVLIVFYAQEGQAGDNAHGPNPKAGAPA